MHLFKKRRNKHDRKIDQLLEQIAYSIKVSELAAYYSHRLHLTDSFKGIALPKFSAISSIGYQFNRRVKRPKLRRKAYWRFQWMRLKMWSNHVLSFNNSRALLVFVLSVERKTIKSYRKVLNQVPLDIFAREVIERFQKKAIKRTQKLQSMQSNSAALSVFF